MIELTEQYQTLFRGLLVVLALEVSHAQRQSELGALCECEEGHDTPRLRNQVSIDERLPFHF